MLGRDPHKKAMECTVATTTMLKLTHIGEGTEGLSACRKLEDVIASCTKTFK